MVTYSSDPVLLQSVLHLIDRVNRAWRGLLGLGPRDAAMPRVFGMLLDTLMPALGMRPYTDVARNIALRLEGMALLLDAAGSTDRHALLLRGLVRASIEILRGKTASAELAVATILVEEIEEDLRNRSRVGAIFSPFLDYRWGSER